MKRLHDMGVWADEEFGWPNDKPNPYDIGYAVAERTMDHILDMLIEEGLEATAQTLHNEVYGFALNEGELQQIMEKR